MDVLRDTPYLLREFLSTFMQQEMFSGASKLRILVWLILGILYVISPYDIIPEQVFGVIGLTDDLLIVIYVLITIGLIMQSDLVSRNSALLRREH